MVRVLATWLLVANVASAQLPWSHRLPAEREFRRLRAQDAATRIAAARALAVVGDATRARSTLIDALSIERNTAVRRAIADSLTRRAHPDILEGLVVAFDNARGQDGHAIAMAIAAIGTPPALRVLTEGLARDDLARASRAALESVGLPAAPHLARALREDPTLVAAIELLGRARDVESVPLLHGLSAHNLPQVRRVAVEALGRIGDSRGRGAVLGALTDADAAVAQSAWYALRGVAGPEDAPRIEAELAGGDPAKRRVLLETLLGIAPQRGTAVLVGWVTSEDPALVRIASDLAIANPHPNLVSVLYGLFQEGTRREEAAAALSEVEGGLGVSVLLREVSAPAAQREIAVAVRRWGSQLSRGTRRAARRSLRTIHDDAVGSERLRLLMLRALARDDDVASAVEEAVASDDPIVRRAGAHAAWLLGDTSLASALQTAIEDETDIDAWRRQSLALGALGGRVEPSHLWAALQDSRRAPEAALLAATQGWEGRAARRLGRFLRRMLRSSDNRARACAAWSLGRLGDRRAWGALLARVERDDATEVRRAAARALAWLGAPDARTAVAQAARGEADDEVRGWLRRALLRPSPPARGRQVLRFRVVTANQSDGVEVDVVLDDGRWLRMRTLPTGEISLADLPDSAADVRVRVAR
ncbi:MAG: HEAT repeat domain-containing protein [Myxococcota bacterium]